MIAVIDTCFIIDWARYRRKNILTKLFKLILIHEEVLAQIRSPITINFISNLLSQGVVKLYPWSSREEEAFNRLREEIVLDPRIPALERPDILCLIMAYMSNSILLSENKGILRVIAFHPKYSAIKVWTALEVLENAVYRGLLKINDIKNFLQLVKEYEEDTKHFFNRTRMNIIEMRIRKWLEK